ncbi:hypothetical protein F2P81_025526 [Scophthalmus maximus]|uniref:Uncharacterized protein n=1 Tax=Scophthalmus maximus TaxID=52904 RepID=A0A6A4RPW6_SCOMX|nr:hypothetical protein F2P81_025526 [Scophthalmus maximus]
MEQRGKAALILIHANRCVRCPSFDSQSHGPATESQKRLKFEIRSCRLPLQIRTTRHLNIIESLWMFQKQSATAMAGLRVITPAAPEQQRAVDERCVPGMERVDCLAEYLVGLRTETGQTLNNQQASTLIALWQNLLPYDQQRLTYTARHQLLVPLSHLYRYTPTARPSTSVPLATKYSRTGSGQEEVCCSSPSPPCPEGFLTEIATPRQLFPQPAPPSTSARFPFVIDPSPAIGPIVFLAPPVPAAKSIGPDGPLPTPSPAHRPYNRTTDKNKCNQCHQPRNKDNGHGKYYGYIYCPQNANMSLDLWMEEMKRKRAQQK